MQAGLFVWRSFMPIQKNQIHRLEITDLNSDGNGVGKIDGFVVFVPMTAVGDLIEAKIVKVLKQYAFGIVERILSPSPDRIDNDCPVYRQCGGCSLRHIRYEAELDIKRRQVEACFRRIGGIDLTVERILSNPHTEGYRNKAQFPVALRDGKAVAGFYAKRSHRVVPCGDCRLQSPAFAPLVRVILDFIDEYHLPPYDETNHTGLIRNLYLREAPATGEIMVCLVATKKHIPSADELARRLVACNPKVKSVLVNRNSQKTNVILGDRCSVVWGEPVIHDVLRGVDVELSPLSFYQVNSLQAERLYDLAEEYAHLTGEETLVDLYCGAGTIGLSMAGKAKRVIGVEIIPDAVEDARRSAQRNGVRNAEFLCADAKEAARSLAQQGLRPDVVIVDPPRKGCDASVLQSICEMAPQRIVMISCNPATAARDCGLLQQQGYRVEEVAAADLFSRTLHVECVISLVKETISER